MRLGDFAFGGDGQPAVVHINLHILFLDTGQLESGGYSVGRGIFVEIHPTGFCQIPAMKQSTRGLPWPDSALNIVVTAVTLEGMTLVIIVAHTTKGFIDHTFNVVEGVVVEDRHFRRVV